MNPVMIIGGTDSSGGAGLSRDTAIASSLGFEVLPVVTAVTAQSNALVFGAQVMPADFVGRQIEAALATATPAAIKIGMLGNREVAGAVADAIESLDVPVVIDPVIKASSGGRLMAGGFPPKLLSLARLITPNLPEAAALCGQSLARTPMQIAEQAEWFLARGVGAVAIKGGHGQGDASVDHLFDGPQQFRFAAPRLAVEKRGTGCALATAVACNLSSGHELPTAFETAKTFVHGWLDGNVKDRPLQAAG